MKRKKCFFLCGLVGSMLLLASCGNGDDEFRFVGKVVGAELCNSAVTGYIIDVQSPDSIGGTVTVGGIEYRNALMGYKSPRPLKADEKVFGVAYMTKSYAALNCLGLVNNGLPEMILLSVDEDSTDFQTKRMD